MEKEKEQNIFSIFYYTATPNEKKLIIAVCLLSGFFSSGFVGLSVWFQDPHFICQSGSEHHHCTAAEICSSTSNMTANTKSLVYELSLYCEKHSQKIWLLTCTFIGGLFGSLLNLIVHISSEKRKSFLSFLGLIFSFSNFAIFFFIQNETIVAISLMVMMYPVMVGSSYAFTVINEYFSGDLAKASSVFLTLSRGLFGISFGIFCYIINSSAKTLFLTTGCLTFVFSSYLFFYENEKGIKERMTKAPTNILEFFKALWPLKEIRNNFFIFIFVWTTYSVTHNDIFIELGTLGGNLYANICLISSLEVLSSFVTGIIMMRIEAAKSLKLFAGLCGLVFFSFFFYSMNPDNEEDSSFIHYIYLILLMLGKLFAEIVNNLIYVYAPKYLTDQFVSFFLVNIRLFARIFLIFLPAIDEFFDVIGVHVFTFISLLWILGRIVLSFIHEKEQESIPELCHDYAVSISGRMSILSGSMGMEYNVEDLLKNIDIHGTKLSSIRLEKYSNFIKKSKISELKTKRSLGLPLLDKN